MAREKWIKDAIESLSGSGPEWLCLAVVLGVLAYRSPEIIRAMTDRWKVKATTNQKLSHQEQQFQQSLAERKSKRAGKGTSGKGSKK